MPRSPRNGKKHKALVLDIIQKDNYTKNSIIAESVGIGEPQVGRIIRLANEDGTILANKSIISPAKMGLTSIGFIQFKLKDSNAIPRNKTIEHIKKWNNIQEVHNVDGVFDLFVKVRFSNNATKIKFLDYVSSEGNVADTESISVIDTVLETLDVTIDGIED